MTEKEQTVRIKTSDLSGEALEWAIRYADFFQKIENGTLKTKKVGPGRYVADDYQEPKVWDAEKMLSIMKDYCIGVFEDDGKWFASPSLEIVSLMEDSNGGAPKDKPHLDWLQCEPPFLFDGETMDEAVKRCYIEIIHPYGYFDVPLEILNP